MTKQNYLARPLPRKTYRAFDGETWQEPEPETPRVETCKCIYCGKPAIMRVKVIVAPLTNQFDWAYVCRRCAEERGLS